MKNSLTENRRNQLVALLFILPASIPLLVFWIFPVIQSLLLSFTDWDMISPTYKFINIRNYISLFQDPKFGKVLVNTLVFAVGTTIPTIVLGLLLALALNGVGKGLGLYPTLIFSPYIAPMVAVSIVWTWIYDPTAGIANFVLSLFGHPRPAMEQEHGHRHALGHHRDGVEVAGLDDDLLHGSAAQSAPAPD